MGTDQKRRPQFPGPWVEVFLARLRAGDSVPVASAAAGIAHATPYKARKEQPEFARAWAEAVRQSPPRPNRRVPPPLPEVRWEKAFFESLRNNGIVRIALKAAAVSRHTVAKRRADDPEFAAEFADAMEDAADTLEAVARTRAFTGSDTLLIFLLKAARPERFRDMYKKVQVDLTLTKRLAEELGLDEAEIVAEAEKLLKGK